MYTYKAVIYNVVDGDTIDVMIDLGFKVYHKIRLRLADVNTHELNSSDPVSRDLARQAKEFVMQWLNTDVVVQTRKTDKYGRYIATVIYDTENHLTINERLLVEGYAVRYEEN